MKLWIEMRSFRIMRINRHFSAKVSERAAKEGGRG